MIAQSVMSGFHEAHSASSTSTASGPSSALTSLPPPSQRQAPSDVTPSPYHQHATHYGNTNNPAAHPADHSPGYRHGHDGLTHAQNRNGAVNGHGGGSPSLARHGHAAGSGYGHPATNSLSAALHTVTDVHGQQHHQQQQQQQQQHAPLVHGQDVASPTIQYSPGSQHDIHTPAHSGSASPPNKKNTRIPRACDLCSQRKVKCEGGIPPCRPCRELNVPCTYDRVKKRRGPPNRAAEAAREAEKRRRLESSTPIETISTPPLQNAAAEALVSLGAPGGHGVVMDAEQCIAPLGVLQLFVDDFFTYIHPLTPFPHEPTFRQAFENREDRTNPEFLSLLASMVGTLVASFPRSARLHLKSSHNYKEFPRSIMLVDRCIKVALAMRSAADTMLKDVVTVNDAAISYFLGLATGYTMRWNQCRRFLGESLRFLREMGFHRRRPPPTSISLGPDRADDQPTDFISDEIGKRIYWCSFLGVRSMTQMGASSRDLIIPPATANNPYPDYPRQVDDAYILPDRILPQPEGVVSSITGFVNCIQVYQTMEELVRIELAHGMSAYAWDQQKQHLHSALLKVKEVAENLPPELKVDLNALSPVKFPYPQTENEGSNKIPAYQYVPPAYPNNQPNHDVRRLFAVDESKKRSMQYEIQKANIYASIVATRSHYVERYLSLRDSYINNQRIKAQTDAPGSIVYRTAAAADFSSSSLAAAAVQAAAEQAPDETDQLFLAERESIVQNFFSVLLSIEQCNLEPNGGSLISKIRQVACTLLSDRAEHKGEHELRNEEYLRGFLEILTRLEKSGTGSAAPAAVGQSVGNMTQDDEEEELRNWATLREQQQMMARTGFYGIPTM